MWEIALELAESQQSESFQLKIIMQFSAIR